MTIASNVLANRLTRLQLGQESAWGTGVAASSLLCGLDGLPTITPLVKSTIFDEQRGSLVPSYSQAQVQTGGAFDLKGFVTFEDILYLLGAVYGLPSPTGNGATKNISSVAAAASKTITANSLASPTMVTTSTAHGLSNGDSVTISGSNSTPSINGVYVVSACTTYTFTILVNCSVAGTAGTVLTPSLVTTSGSHGLTSGGYVIIAGSDAVPSINGVWQVNVHAVGTFTIAAFTVSGGTAVGTVANPATWTFVPPGPSVFTPVSYTMELENLTDTSAVKLTGGLIQDWTITGTQSKELDFTAKGFGKTFSSGATPTAGLNYRTAEIALMPETVMTFDPAGTVPTTSMANLVSYTLTGNSGLMPFYAAGAKAPTDFTYLKQQLGLKLGVAYTGTVQTALAASLLAGKPCVVQLTCTSGSKAFRFQFCGALKSDPVFPADSQGVHIVELDMDAVYDLDLGLYSKFVVANAVAALP